ncbi:MAG: damage-inducible protein DinB [Xanthobacteraceae bacterium]|nr:damage-inducible protein DinB [Xanthobacteraceae bacterium]MBX3522164.1 damage-inducible protein DinB [Xanthobacteraceae bacterium]MBX3534132.1 damage-inducible protein DinB [Xanthobacteraceae bacterium]MCW5678683.1 damage-inducible protein DinB [Xanthobacteraceae bacterium]
MSFDRYKMFAGYNAWANERLYDAAAKLSAEEYRADRGAFFKSIHGTLNHILVADRIWMKRFTGQGEAPATLDAILHEDLDSLRAARDREDARIEAYIGQLTEEELAATFSYMTVTNPKQITQPLSPALDHFFNHQTHHRGQAHAVLTGLRGKDFAPSLDMILYQRETGTGGVVSR